MSKQEDVAKVRLNTKSDESDFFVGPMFSVSRERDYTDITYSAKALTAVKIGDSAVTLFQKGDFYKTALDVVQQGETKILHHSNGLMVTAIELPDAVYFTVVIDSFKPINNLYVNTESK